MRRDELSEVKDFTARIMQAYYRDADPEPVIAALDPEVVWMGLGDQREEGNDAVAARLRAGRQGMLPCRMAEESYTARSLGGGLFWGSACTRLLALEEGKGFPESRQSITFIIRRKEKVFRVLHIHYSMAYPGFSSDPMAWGQETRDAFRRLESTIAQERRQKEREVMEARAEIDRKVRFLTQLYNTVPCGILQFTIDPAHSVVSINRMCWEFYGFSSEKEYRKYVNSPVEMVFDEDKEKIVRMIEALKLGDEAVSYIRETKKRNGSSAWISVVMERIVNAEGREVIQAVFTDITRIQLLQMEQEKERTLENRSLRAAICNAYPLIMSLNLTQNTFRCFTEDQTSFMAGREGRHEDMCAEMIEKVYPAYREEYAQRLSRSGLLKTFAAGEREVYMEMQHMGDDGVYHWISVQVIYVDNPFGEDVHGIELVKVLDNQRAEKAAHDQLLRDALAAAEAANSAKSDFLSRMSHDIRTPMNAIIGMTALGLFNLDKPERVEDCFRKIDTSSRYLLSLINDILDMSKIENGKMSFTKKAFDFAGLMEEISSILYPQTRERGIEFEIRGIEPIQQYYVGDGLRLKQILMNILGNALKFTGKGGRIWVDIWEEKRSAGYTFLAFRVSDNGIGMTPEFLKKLFKPFEQENPEAARNNVGTGLGLAIVYNLVQLLNGSIEVQSEKGKGTVFNVKIPVAYDTLANLKDKKSGGQEKEGRVPNLSSRKVLLVEDNRLNMEIAKAMLEMAGLTVTVAEDGKKAVQAFEASKQGDFSAILMDIRMPNMDGLEATRRIRASKHPDADAVPIVAMTANAFDEDRTQAFDAGMTGYMIKPLDMQVLFKELENLI